jgi:hypothetical protein
MLSWISRKFHKHIAQHVPNSLCQCEFGCRVGQCSRGKWEECERGIQFAKQLDELATSAITPAERPADFSLMANLSLWQRAWPFAALMLACSASADIDWLSLDEPVIPNVLLPNGSLALGKRWLDAVCSRRFFHAPYRLFPAWLPP